jgi:hypothetical protein
MRSDAAWVAKCASGFVSECEPEANTNAYRAGAPYTHAAALLGLKSRRTSGNMVIFVPDTTTKKYEFCGGIWLREWKNKGARNWTL